MNFFDISLFSVHSFVDFDKVRVRIFSHVCVSASLNFNKKKLSMRWKLNKFLSFANFLFVGWAQTETRTERMQIKKYHYYYSMVGVCYCCGHLRTDDCGKKTKENDFVLFFVSICWRSNSNPPMGKDCLYYIHFSFISSWFSKCLQQ